MLPFSESVADCPLHNKVLVETIVKVGAADPVLTVAVGETEPQLLEICTV